MAEAGGEGAVPAAFDITWFPSELSVFLTLPAHPKSIHLICKNNATFVRNNPFSLWRNATSLWRDATMLWGNATLLWKNATLLWRNAGLSSDLPSKCHCKTRKITLVITLATSNLNRKCKLCIFEICMIAVWLK